MSDATQIALLVGVPIVYAIIAGIVHVFLTRDGEDGDEGLVSAVWLLVVVVGVAVGPFYLAWRLPRWILALARTRRHSVSIPRAEVRR